MTNGKKQVVLQDETTVDATVQYTDPHHHVGATAAANTQQETAEQNQADGISVFVAAALGSRVVWAQGKFLWAPSLLRSPVPVEEGTA